MFNQPKTKEEAAKKAYGTYGRSKYDPTRCAYEVYTSDNGWPRHSQCQRKAGHGPEEMFCKQHAPDQIKARQAAQDVAYEIKRRKWRIENRAHQFYDALKQIADGHNDARTLAKETIKDLL